MGLRADRDPNLKLPTTCTRQIRVIIHPTQEIMPSLESLLQDLRYASRVLAREPTLFAGAALVLALGVGANSAVFSLAHAVLLEPLPFERPEGVVLLRPTAPSADGEFHPRDGATRTFIQAWQARSTSVLSDLAAVRLAGAGATPYDVVFSDRAERLRAAEVTPNFFSILGARPAAGRLFSEQDDGHDVVVLSHGLWHRRFAADPEVIGQTIQMTSGRGKTRRQRLFTVVGVLPEEFRFVYPLQTQIWALHSWNVFDAARPRSIEFWGAIGRLNEGVSLEAARAQLVDAIEVDSGRAGRSYRFGTDVRTLQEWMAGETRPSVLLLAAVAALLLLTACVAAAGTLLVRLDARRGELAVRSALGAGRARLTRQLLTEGLLLAGLGTMGGVAMAWATVPLLRALVPAAVPRGEQVAAYPPLLLAAASIATLVTLAAALAPVRHAAREASAAASRAGGGQTPSRSGERLRLSLVTLQSAVAVVLLVATGLLLTSFWNLHQVDLGFDGDRVWTAEMRLLDREHFEPGALNRFQDGVMERVRAIPGVLEAGMTSAVPFRGVDWTIRYGPDEDSREYLANRREVDPGYFEVMGLQLVSGRFFTDDDDESSGLVAVVSERAALDAFGRLDVLGELVPLKDRATIVGVVKDVRYRSLHEEPTAAIYLPRAQQPSELMCLVVRATDGVEIGTSLREAVRAVDPTVPLMNTTTVDAIIAESVSGRRFYTVTTTVFAALALLITAVGLSVVVARSIAERRRELAVRAALGARPAQLTATGMRRGLLAATLGAAIGTWTAWAASSLIEQFSFDLSVHDPTLYAAAALFTLTIVATAALIPARRAGNSAPATLLKEG